MTRIETFDCDGLPDHRVPDAFSAATHTLVASADDKAKGEYDPTVSYETTDTTAVHVTQ